MTHLRRAMLEELQRRNYAKTTVFYYLKAVERFAKYFHTSPGLPSVESRLTSARRMILVMVCEVTTNQRGSRPRWGPSTRRYRTRAGRMAPIHCGWQSMSTAKSQRKAPRTRQRPPGLPPHDST